MSISKKLSGKYGNGKEVLLSKIDYNRIGNKSLCVLKAGYVMIWSNGKTHYLHRWIFDLDTGNRNEDHVDHISGDKLDCRRENLRIGTRSDNMCNIKKANVLNPSSKYKGVSKKGDRWTSNIKKNGKNYYLGLFDNELKAALAYNEKALELHKNYAVLNIITDNDINISILNDMKKTNPELSKVLDKQISKYSK
jgi:hypothetical protein